MLSLFGGNRTLFGEGNPAPVQLTPKARDGLIQLTQKARDGRTQWRLCNAIVETHLTDLLGWVREQGDRRELLEGTVTIHHYQFGVIPEPYAAAFLRAAGYLARLARDAGSVREADETHRNLERRYYRLSGTGDPKLVAALATGLGYIGDWKPVLEVFENRRVREQATWMDLTAKNVLERWILPNRSELEAAFSWIQKRLDSIADLPPEDRSTLLQLRELVWKRRDETDF
ncbi:MAG TPA: hypothetical protein VMM92_08435 [Thermoanaerobaculia bacterium]|nr:hypothetical protein [Thermoanaerobaculia bacterium]